MTKGSTILKPYIVSYDYKRYNLIDPVIKPKNMTLKEVDEAIVECYRRFYMGKLQQLRDIDNPFRKGYLLAAMKRVMQNSFLVGKIGNLGEQMPEHVKKAIDEISLEADHFKGDISKCPVTKLKKFIGIGKK